MKSDAYAQVLADAQAFRRPSVLIALAELDLATVILRHGNAMKVQEVAEVTESDLRAMAILLDALASLGYLTKCVADEGASYSVPPQWRNLLDSSHPHSVIPYIRHMGTLQRSWINVAKAVREGCPQSVPPGLLSSDEERLAFIMAMNSVGLGLRPRVLTGLRDAGAMPHPRAHILDVGGASGTYAEAFLEALPESSVTLFDLPMGIAQARRRFGRHPRVTLVSGDFMVDEFPVGADYAWVSAIIHQLSMAQCVALFCKIFRALQPGGMIAVRDYVMAADRINPVEGTLFGINMLMRTASGQVYTYEEIRSALEEAGFTNVRYAVPDGAMGSVVTAEKP